MLKNQRSLVVFIFVLSILYLLYWFGNFSKLKNNISALAATTQAPYSTQNTSVIVAKLMSSSNSTSLQGLKTMSASDDHDQQTRVIILTLGRSGSSFLGGMFNAHPDIFYIYEPLFHLTKYRDQESDRSYLKKAEQALHSILNCNFTDGLYLKSLSKFEGHRASSRPLVSPPFCRVGNRQASNFIEHKQWGACRETITAHALNNACRNKRHVVVKILLYRLKPAHVPWLLQIFSASSFPVHVLNLVRDPRGMYFSRYKLGWIAPVGQRKASLQNGYADCKIRNICNDFEQHLRESNQYPETIQLLRYEDFATNPEAFVGQLFPSLHIRPSVDVIRWIRGKNHPPKKKSNAYSLTRVSEIVVNSWQKNIPTQLVGIVERRCNRIMKYLGYLPTNGSLTSLRKLQKPLFSHQWGNVQFILPKLDEAADGGQLRRCSIE